MLLVIAGCNGSGKSSFSDFLTPKNLVPFDYDKYFLKNYNSLMDSELRDRMAHNITREFLDNSVQHAISKRKDFCYETNFNSTPMFWPNKFEQAGYELKMLFFCLNSLEEAKRRVMIRVENGGHYVPEKEIENRYYLGYKNLDTHFHRFKGLHLLNSSFYNQPPKHILSLKNSKVAARNKFPKFLKPLIPNIHKILSNLGFIV